MAALLFLLYVNDLTRVPNTSLYADDTTLVASELSLPMACNSLQSEIRSVVEWMRLWKLRPNAGKTVILCIPPHPRSDLSHIDQYLFHFPDDRTPIPIVSHHKHLGVIFDSGMSWSQHLEYLERRTSSAVGVLYSHMSHLPLVCRRAFYASYILPIILYCSIVWCSAGAGMLARLELMHRRILRAIFRFPLDNPLTILYSQCKTCPLQTIINRLCCRCIHQIKLLKAPMHIQNALNWINSSSSSRNKLRFPISRNNSMSRSPVFISYCLWDSLPQNMQSCENISAFVRDLSDHFP